MLGGVKNKPNYIWYYTLFILTTKHYIGIFKLKDLGEEVYWCNGTIDSIWIMLCVTSLGEIA